MEQEAAMSRWVDEHECQLESTHCESQDQAAEATGARAVELLAMKWATTAELGLNIAKVHLAEIEAVL